MGLTGNLLRNIILGAALMVVGGILGLLFGIMLEARLCGPPPATAKEKGRDADEEGLVQAGTLAQGDGALIVDAKMLGAPLFVGRSGLVWALRTD